MENTVQDEVESINRAEAISAVEAVETVVPSVDSGYDKGFAAGHAAGVHEASEAAVARHNATMEAVAAKHVKVLEALASKSAKAASIVEKRHAKMLERAKDDTAEALADTAEADEFAVTARLVAIQEVLDLLDARIGRGHIDGRLAVMDVRDLIVAHFADE